MVTNGAFRFVHVRILIYCLHFFSIRGTAVSVTSVHNTYLNDTCTHTYRLEMSKDNCPFVTKVSIFVKDIIMLYPQLIGFEKSFFSLVLSQLKKTHMRCYITADFILNSSLASVRPRESTLFFPWQAERLENQRLYYSIMCTISCVNDINIQQTVES